MEPRDNNNIMRLFLTVDRNQIAAHFESEEIPAPDKLLELDHDLDRDLLAMCRRFIEADLVPSREDFETIGQLLYRTLFTQRVTDVFKHELAARKQDGKKLCIELRFINQDTKGDLSILPWEYSML